MRARAAAKFLDALEWARRPGRRSLNGPASAPSQVAGARPENGPHLSSDRLAADTNPRARGRPELEWAPARGQQVCAESCGPEFDFAFDFVLHSAKSIAARRQAASRSRVQARNPFAMCSTGKSRLFSLSLSLCLVLLLKRSLIWRPLVARRQWHRGQEKKRAARRASNSRPEEVDKKQASGHRCWRVSDFIQATLAEPRLSLSHLLFLGRTCRPLTWTGHLHTLARRVWLLAAPKARSSLAPRAPPPPPTRERLSVGRALVGWGGRDRRGLLAGRVGVTRRPRALSQRGGGPIEREICRSSALACPSGCARVCPGLIYHLTRVCKRRRRLDLVN